MLGHYFTLASWHGVAHLSTRATTQISATQRETARLQAQQRAHEEADRPCRPPHRPAQDLRAQDLSPPTEGEEQDLGAQSAPGADRGEQDRHGYERD